MAVDMSMPRTRRALLASGIGGFVAVVASALGRPLPVRAGSDGDVVLGADNPATATTGISTGPLPTGPGATALRVGTFDATAIEVHSYGGSGVVARTKFGAVAVSGLCFGGGGDAISGNSVNGSGVVGSTGARYTRFPVGHTPPAEPPAAGIVGLAGSGAVGGYFESGDEGTALWAGRGKVVFGQRSGQASVATGKSRVDVNMQGKGGLDGTPLLFANLTDYRSGVFVAAVRPNCPSAGQFRIYLNKAVASSTRVSWLVLD